MHSIKKKQANLEIYTKAQLIQRFSASFVLFKMTQYVSARSRADVNYLKKCTNNYEKVERPPNRKFVSVTQIYSRHEDAIQRSLDIAEHLANQPSPIKLDEKEQHRIAREKEVERQQKLKRKAQQEEEAKRRQKTEKEKKAKEAEDDAVLQAEYEKNLKAQNTQGGKVRKLIPFINSFIHLTVKKREKQFSRT